MERTLNEKRDVARKVLDVFIIPGGLTRQRIEGKLKHKYPIEDESLIGNISEYSLDILCSVGDTGKFYGWMYAGNQCYELIKGLFS